MGKSIGLVSWFWLVLSLVIRSATEVAAFGMFVGMIVALLSSVMVVSDDDTMCSLPP